MRIRYADHLQQLHGRVPAQERFDFQGRDVLAPDLEHVVEPAAVRDPVVRVQHAPLPGVEPALGVEGISSSPRPSVICKPYLAGKYRPDWKAPNIDGLYFASETFKSRGIGLDRAALGADPRRALPRQAPARLREFLALPAVCGRATMRYAAGQDACRRGVRRARGDRGSCMRRLSGAVGEERGRRRHFAPAVRRSPRAHDAAREHA
jgi:hypothetical protein